VVERVVKQIPSSTSAGTMAGNVKQSYGGEASMMKKRTQPVMPRAALGRSRSTVWVDRRSTVDWMQRMMTYHDERTATSTRIYVVRTRHVDARWLGEWMAKQIRFSTSAETAACIVKQSSRGKASVTTTWTQSVIPRVALGWSCSTVDWMQRMTTATRTAQYALKEANYHDGPGSRPVLSAHAPAK
jgi:hypothetical protein